MASTFALSATITQRRRIAAAAVSEAAHHAAGLGSLATNHSSGVKVVPNHHHVEHHVNSHLHHPKPYPGFAAEPPLLLRPLMHIDPEHYHHFRRIAHRVKIG